MWKRRALVKIHRPLNAIEPLKNHRNWIWIHSKKHRNLLVRENVWKKNKVFSYTFETVRGKAEYLSFVAYLNNIISLCRHLYEPQCLAPNFVAMFDKLNKEPYCRDSHYQFQQDFIKTLSKAMVYKILAEKCYKM